MRLLLARWLIKMSVKQYSKSTSGNQSNQTSSNTLCVIDLSIYWRLFVSIQCKERYCHWNTKLRVIRFNCQILKWKGWYLSSSKHKSFENVYFDLCSKVVLLKAQPDSLHIKLLAWGSFSLKGERDKEMTLFVASQGVCMRWLRIFLRNTWHV